MTDCFQIDAWQNNAGFAGVERVTYRTANGEDWALAWPGTRDGWVVQIHGHGSTGDQIFTRPDVRDIWLGGYRKLGLGVLSCNLRGNAWMCPEVVDDLHQLLGWARAHFSIADYYFFSGSMGGTSNLIYGVRHPEDVTAMMACCAATDIAGYARWLRERPGGIRDEIYQAIVSAYGGTPEEQAEKYAVHSALRNAERLAFPLLLCHGDADALIPVEESRRLATALAGRQDVTYLEIPDGDHDSPLFQPALLEWLARRVKGEE